MTDLKMAGVSKFCYVCKKDCFFRSKYARHLRSTSHQRQEHIQKIRQHALVQSESEGFDSTSQTCSNPHHFESDPSPHHTLSGQGNVSLCALFM